MQLSVCSVRCTQETLAAVVTTLTNTGGTFADWTKPRPFVHQRQGDGVVKRPGMAVSLSDSAPHYG